MNSRHLPFCIMSEAICSRFSFGIIGFALPLYALHLGMDEAMIGTLMAVHFGFEVACKPLLGRLSDKVGRKTALCLALGLRSIVALSLGVISTVAGLFAVRALHGVSEAIREPAMNALLIETNARKILSAFARYNSVRMLAGAAGKATAGYLITASNQQYLMIFILAFAISACSIVAIALMPPANRSPARKTSGTGAQAENAARTGLRNQPVYAYGFLCGVSASILNLLFPVLAVKYGGLSEAEVGAIYLVGGLAVAAFTLIIEKLDGRTTDTAFLSMRAASTLCSTALYGIGSGMVPFAIGAAADEGGKLAFKAGWGSMLAKVSEHEPDRRAAIASRFGVIENLAEISGPVLGGFLLASGGPVLLLGARAGISIAGELILYFSLKKS